MNEFSTLENNDLGFVIAGREPCSQQKFNIRLSRAAVKSRPLLAIPLLVPPIPQHPDRGWGRHCRMNHGRQWTAAITNSPRVLALTFHFGARVHANRNNNHAEHRTSNGDPAAPSAALAQLLHSTSALTSMFRGKAA